MEEVKSGEMRGRKSLDDYEDDDGDGEITPVPSAEKGPKTKSRKRDKTRSKEPMELEIKLGPRELAKRKEAVAKLQDVLWDVEDQRKRLTGPLDKKARELKREIRKERSVIKEEKELRNVVADCLIDYDAGVVEVYFEGELVKEMSYRDLKKLKEERVNESQEELFNRGSSGKKAPAR